MRKMHNTADDKSGKRKKVIRIVSLCILVAVMIFVTIICIPIVKMLSTEEGRAGLERLVDSNFLLGVCVYMFLQVLQVLVALIPGGVIQILGGVLFGNFWGTVLCSLGILAGSAIVFFMVRRFGMPVVEAFIDRKGIKKFEFLNDTKKLEITVFILFLIPGMPKDVLTYLAPLTKIKPSSFLALSMLGRFPAILLSIVFGANLSEGNILAAVVIFAVVAVVGIIGILYNGKIVAYIKSRRKM
ncbi:MAG TPA: TVP38/TMEM64 family protein [Candidatus Faeciplasma gallinarum]|uniref:TVP38/TMEM64 family membrane protein n=1 Tax=Candidatus Faeciplasma gallinarum TaxID=2840799 RepID=A0A9D1ENA3_9FIRM|nr:TVP38/TMEM64 family protein [Candidatus Faeciplasma gallinarum]